MNQLKKIYCDIVFARVKKNDYTKFKITAKKHSLKLLTCDIKDKVYRNPVYTKSKIAPNAKFIASAQNHSHFEEKIVMANPVKLKNHQEPSRTNVDRK